MAVFTPAPSGTQSSADWSGKVCQPLSEEELANEQFTSKTRVQFYSDHAANYDEDMVKYEYGGSDTAAKILHELLDGNYEARILDAACGTGLAAEKLSKLGPYANMVGLEPAEGMLAVAIKKGIYKETLCQYLYLDCGLEHDVYDGALCAGSFVPGHLKSDCLIELCNVLKSGGYLVITMRDEHLSTVKDFTDNMMPIISKLVSEGKWKVLRDEVFSDWIYGEAGPKGHLFVFQKL